MIRYFLSLLFILLLFQSCSQHNTKLSVNNLKCEYRQNPLGIEEPAPRLSWELLSGQRSVLQTAYRILVADNIKSLENNEGNIWDTEKVDTDRTIQIAYAGKKLEPTKSYFWKVMVWDNHGNESDWSKVALWQMGLPTQKDWGGAQWIAYEEMAKEDRIVPAFHGKGRKGLDDGFNTLPLLRKEFTLESPLQKATAYISGLGHFEMSINGKKVGDHFLDPGWTDYDEHALYVTFNVTEQLRQGENVLGVMLGNGFYHIPRGNRYRKITGSFGYPKMICKIVLEYQDGRIEYIDSDGTWKTSSSPITFSSIYGGEDYDARLEQPRWNDAGFVENDSWKPVVIVEGPKLESQMAPPVKILEEFSPIAISQPEPGVWVYDLGQNASGIVDITVQGEKGAALKITPGELLNEDGRVSQKATGGPYYFHYTLKGEAIEHWHPRFTYYGFRYVQVEGGVPEGELNADNLPVVLALKGLHHRNSVERTGQFSSSSELFNKTEKLIDWAIKSNMMSVFTDCPHREKLGWLEQAHLVGSSIRYSYDIASFCKKIVRDMQVSQTENGLIPNIAPEYIEFEFNGDDSFRDSPEWGSNGVIMPWYMYQWYGDKRVLEESYPMMQRYVMYLKSKSQDHIVSHGLSDWYDLGPERPGFSQLTPYGVTATAIYYYDLQILGKVAKLLGKVEDVKAYETLANKVKEAFNNTFFNEETKQYATGSQAANAMAIYMNLVEPQYREEVINNIVEDIKKKDNGLTTGDVGYRYLLKVLDEAGRSDLIYDMNSRTDVPGYGYQLAQGATALTESWQALPVVSNNHFMLGHILEWFYSGLGGIRLPENAIAYKTIEIYPEPVGNITSANASVHSPYGMIRTDWQKSENSFELSIEIPPNTSAVIYLPTVEGAEIFESGKVIENNLDIEYLEYKNERAVLKVGSGVYHFLSEG